MKRRVSIQVLVGGTILLACLWPIRFRTDPQFWFRVMDAAHLPVFAALAAWLAACWMARHGARAAGCSEGGPGQVNDVPRPPEANPHRPGVLRPFLFAALLASLCAGAVEGLQACTGRNPNWGDFMNGVWGALLGAGAVAVWATTKRRWVRAGYAVFVVLALGFVSWPALAEARALRWRARHFPVLGDFESTVELRVWRPQGGTRQKRTRIRRTAAWASRGARSLQVEPGAGNWPGVFFNAGRQDWRGYDALVVDLCWPDSAPECGRRAPRGDSALVPAFELIVRVDADGAAGQPARYQQGFVIAPGHSTLRIPLTDIAAGTSGAPLDLECVRRVVLFLGEPRNAPREFHIDHVRLEKD